MHLQNIEWGYMVQKEEGVGDNHLVPAFKRHSQWYRPREKGSISRKSDSSCGTYSSLLIASVKSKTTVPEKALANAIWPTLSFLSILREVFKETKWNLLMEFSIKRQTPLNEHNFHPFFPPTFFLPQLNLTYMKRILHLVPVKIFILKSFYNWVKIDILRLVRLRPAILYRVFF